MDRFKNEKELLFELQNLCIKNKIKFVYPHVSYPDDEIMFEWWCADKKITIYWFEGVLDFIKIPKNLSEMEDGYCNSLSDIMDLLKWLQE